MPSEKSVQRSLAGEGLYTVRQDDVRGGRGRLALHAPAGLRLQHVDGAEGVTAERDLQIALWQHATRRVAPRVTGAVGALRDIHGWR